MEHNHPEAPTFAVNKMSLSSLIPPAPNILTEELTDFVFFTHTKCGH